MDNTGATVVIAAFSMDRWNNLCETVASVRHQTVPAVETVVVIDHNTELMDRAVSELPGITVVANTGSRGASGARNTGAAASRSEILAFLDDDVVAHPNWLETLLRHFKDPAVVGVGGQLVPSWNTCRPPWFPPEFDWALGCSYRGMPEKTTQVRNVWTSNMAIRRQVFDAVGGFRKNFGKVGSRSQPEDTDLCLRAAEFDGGGTWIYDPNAIADHRVPAARTTFRYFLRRCYDEGKGKAALVSLNGANQSTSVERDYTKRVLPTALGRGLRDAVGGDWSGGQRSSAVAAGFIVTASGFLVEQAGSTIRKVQRSSR